MKTLWALLMLAISCSARSIDLAGPWKLQLDDNPRWAQPGVDDSSWPTVTLPRRRPRPERAYWLRRTVPAPVSGTDLYVSIGLVSESYELYANGVRIGGTGDFGKTDVRFFQARSFRLPFESARSGRPLVIALRIWDAGVAWGAMSNGLADHGPYWIGPPEQIAAEIRAAELGIRLALVPALMILLGQAGILVCLLILWLPERQRRDLLFFGGFLLSACSSLILGLSLAFTGGSSFLYRLGYRPTGTLAFLFLFLSATAILRLRPYPGALIAVTALLSLSLGVAPVRSSAYLFPWLALISWQSLHAIRISPRTNLPFAVPFLLYCAGVTNNNLPPEYRLFPTSIEASGMTLSVTNLMQFLFAAAMLVLLLRRLGADRREKQRLASEFEAARGVQQLLLSGASGPSNDYTIETVYLPAEEVGGDLYCVLPDCNGSFAVVVGDVSGKGLKAALQVSLVIGALRETKERRPARVLGALNDVVFGQTGGGFITCCCAHFSADGIVSFANAGHLSPYVRGVDVEGIAGLPLGVSADQTYSEELFTLAEGEQLTLLSDGVVESANSKHEMFGFDRTREIARKPARQIAEAAKAWGQNDDITVVTVRRSA